MAISYQQTDNAAACGPISACSGVALSGTTTDSRDCPEEPATAGTTEVQLRNSANSGIQATVMDQFTPGFSQWPSGDYTARLNVTTGGGAVTWARTYVCRLDSGCNTLETLGSTTGQGISLSTTGVKSQTIPCSGTTANETDSVYIVYVFNYGGQHGNVDAYITPDQLIDTPLTGVFNQTATADVSTSVSTSLGPTAAETLTLSGTVTVDGTAQSNATVYITEVDEATGTATLESTQTTDANGDWSATLSRSGGTFHVAAKYDDGSTLYAGESKPYL